MLTLEGKYGKDCKVFIDNIEESALRTIYSILDDKVSDGVPVRIMPDTHDGIDIVIGFTMPLTGMVNPNHIGVDIGCGVSCIEIPSIDISLSEVNQIIRQVIPMGFSHRERPLQIDESFGSAIEDVCRKTGQDISKVTKQIGTLGGGNHFIEIGRGDGRDYLFIHSGSRNFGLQICKYHSDKAKRQGEKYLYETDITEYLEDMKIAQRFAELNRDAIGKSILNALGVAGDKLLCDTIHNYIDFEKNIIRKGAVSANEGERLVIPMNMRDGVLLCTGKGNPDWNYSAPHGAGRVLARGEAKRKLDLKEFEKEMDGIFSTSVNSGTLDESPMAYKDMATIIRYIGETVELNQIVKPILNIKA